MSRSPTLPGNVRGISLVKIELVCRDVGGGGRGEGGREGGRKGGGGREGEGRGREGGGGENLCKHLNSEWQYMGHVYFLLMGGMYMYIAQNIHGPLP